MKFFYTIFLSVVLFWAQAQTILTVGPGQQYNSITTAYAAIPNNFTGAYIISLQTGYSALNETFPITLTAKSASSATNTITIRPAVSGLLIGSADTTGTFVFNGSRYVTIDGRVNGTGTVPDLTVINSNTFGAACMFYPGSNYNTLSYTNAQGANNAILFNGQYATTAGSGNKINNCNISGLGGGFCNYGINYLGTKNTWPYTKTLYNNIFNFNTNGVSYGGLFDNSVIQGNSFYITQAHVVLDNWSAINVSLSQVNFIGVGASNVEVLGNFVGGSAPQCAGLLYCDMRTAKFIVTDVSRTNPSYVDSNIITNISIYDTIGNAPYGSINLMALGGNVLAGTRFGNHIGDTISNDAIMARSSYSKPFMLLYFQEYSSSVLVENTVAGSITLSGNLANFYYAYNSVNHASHVTLRNNFFGSSVNRSCINFNDPVFNAFGYYTYQVDTVDNNVFSGLTVNSPYLNFYGVDSADIVVNNVIRNLSIQGTNVNTANANSNFLVNAKTVKGNHISSVYMSYVTQILIFISGNVMNNTVDSLSFMSKATYPLVRGIHDPNYAAPHIISGNRFSNLTVIDSNNVNLVFNGINSVYAAAIDSNIITGVVIPYGYSVVGINFNGNNSLQLINNTISHFTGAAMYGIFTNTNGQGLTNQTILLNNNTISDIDNGLNGICMKNVRYLVISNNKIARINSLTSATGIYTETINGTYCGGNTITGMHTVNSQTGQVSVVAAGINMSSYYDTIVNNVVDNISVKGLTGCTISLAGIQYYALANTTLLRNNAFTHLWIDSGSANSALYGIRELSPASGSCYNNLVQLGVKSDGTVSTSNSARYGMYVPNNSNQLQYSFYYNTVYVAGNVANSNNNSFAFYSGNLNNSIYNNIFMNAVSTAGGTGKNYSIALPGYLNQALDFNIYHAAGVHGLLASIDTGIAGISTLAAFKTAILGQNLNAIDTDAHLINAAGDTAALNLGPATGSAAVANATTYHVPTTIDYYGVTRSVTTPAIGAIEKAGYQVPVIDSIVNVTCSTNTTGAIIINLPNGIVWSTVQVLNSNSVVVAGFSNVTGQLTAGQLTAGSYTLKFTNPTAGTITLSATVQSTIQAAPAPVVTRQVICVGTSTVLTATNGSNYQWYDSLSNGNLLGNSATLNTGVLNATKIFYVESNPGGCASPRSADTVVVLNLQAPVLTASAPNVCYGQNITLSGSSLGGTVNWYTQATGGSAVATGSNYTLVAGSQQTYYANVTQGSCASPTDSITLTIDTLPAAPVFTTTRTAVCPGSKDTLSLQNDGLTCTWYTSATGGNSIATGLTYITPVISSAATYYAAAFNGQCYSLRQAEHITLLADPDPVIQPSPYSLCPGQSATFTVSNSNNGIVNWYVNRAHNTSVGIGSTFTTPGLNNSVLYYAMVQYPNGCVSSLGLDSAVVRAQVKPVVTVNGVTLTSNQSNGNQWYFNSNIINGATASSYTATVTGNYFVVTTNTYGCADTSDTHLVVVTGIGQVENDDLRVYPSPNNGSFFITCTEVLPAQLKIMDINGKVVYTQLITDKVTHVVTANLARGIYAAVIEASGYSAKAVFVKQ